MHRTGGSRPNKADPLNGGGMAFEFCHFDSQAARFSKTG
jgi:hypothetical protein